MLILEPAPGADGRQKLHPSRVCVERCEIDADCDVPAGFGCEFIAGDRLAWSHPGALSKEIRHVVEQRLIEGRANGTRDILENPFVFFIGEEFPLEFVVFK